MSGVDPLATSRAHRFRVRTGAAIVLVLVAIVVAILVSTLTAGTRGSAVAVRPSPSASGTALIGGAMIFVHVLGEVARPGVYQLRDGDRALDAIAAAGGFTTDADRHQLNLARFLSDGEQIDVPVAGAAPSAAPTAQQGGKVNLNTADAATLETLPRVGPAMAERIIRWREENGRFTSVEDLLGVTGIGEKTFAELKELVSV